ncbi:SDR family oxidoreductase [Bordetella hinzii]|uniref:SDR family oxidoreductase n=1 Tax=Bordetella hinzii TaxID=103855 RepID=UPI0004595491|nr:SDR family oxidoreductase [Bordetella hinzii]KCB52813.1 NAD(P)H-binding protein, PF13460 family [Bordetella hinzii 1277]MCJ9711153.1 SDR family oxidoreductase [Bordetella hinzii]QDJ49564.1 NmrA family transcriptional regulator [Bordetella hinzii]QII83924.1 SDR family oxidoreductase [Bordetella hinzii]WPL79275.1 SDR family oxidoreductase [Bordetella hinzii]
MKVLVIGGTGLIGSKLVKRLIGRGHEAMAASPATGVNTLTGEGLDAALAGVDTVVDVANSPSFEDRAVLDFFQASGRNLLAAEARAGVRHHVALSVVGTQRLAESGYFRGKIVQEQLIKAASIPYTIVQSTQFFEFLGGIVQAGTVGGEVRLSPAWVQPIASDDVAQAMADAALGPALNATVEIAGPERMRLAELAERYLRQIGDTRPVRADWSARYFGALLGEDTLLPGPRLGTIGFDTWFSRSGARH